MTDTSTHNETGHKTLAPPGQWAETHTLTSGRVSREEIAEILREALKSQEVQNVFQPAWRFLSGEWLTENRASDTLLAKAKELLSYEGSETVIDIEAAMGQGSLSHEITEPVTLYFHASAEVNEVIPDLITQAVYRGSYHAIYPTSGPVQVLKAQPAHAFAPGDSDGVGLTATKTVNETLAEIEALEPDWDAYGARQVSPVACRLARKFLRLLPPQIEDFDIYPEPDGSIGWECHKGAEFSLFLSFTPDEEIAYVAVYRENDQEEVHRGRGIKMVEKLPKVLQPFIDELIDSLAPGYSFRDWSHSPKG